MAQTETQTKSSVHNKKRLHKWGFALLTILYGCFFFALGAHSLLLRYGPEDLRPLLADSVGPLLQSLKHPAKGLLFLVVVFVWSLSGKEKGAGNQGQGSSSSPRTRSFAKARAAQGLLQASERGAQAAATAKFLESKKDK